VSTSYSDRVLTALYDSTLASTSAARTTRPTPLYIIASPRALCGKTFLALLMADYLFQDGGNVAAYDLNPGEYALATCRPRITTKADLATTPGQIALFDRLIANEGKAKIIDLGYSLFERFFDVCKQVEFVEAARRRGFEVIILFPAEPHPSATAAYENMQSCLPDAVLVPVLNEAILKGERVHESYQVDRQSAAALQVPLMPPALKAYADRLSQSLAQVRAHLPANMPKDHALELSSWTRSVFLEFREFELRLTLEKLRMSMRT
jgi:hypothetical protein